MHTEIEVPKNLAFADAIVFYGDLLGFSHQVAAAGTLAEADGLIRVLKRFAGEFTESGDMHDFFGRKYWAISDSMVAVWDMQSEAAKTMTEFDAILHQLSGLAIAQGRMLVDDGQLVRGGVARGWFKEDSDTIVSPALVRAARIEGAIASPFIGVDADLYAYFASHQGRGMYAPQIDPIPDVFIAPAAYTAGLPALDYLTMTLGEIELSTKELKHAMTIPPGEARDDYMNQRAWENKLEFMRRHRDIIAKALGTHSGSVLNKYQALRDYHNERVQARFQDPSLLV
jgi:hypothetical protein